MSFTRSYICFLSGFLALSSQSDASESPQSGSPRDSICPKIKRSNVTPLQNAVVGHNSGGTVWKHFVKKGDNKTIYYRISIKGKKYYINEQDVLNNLPRDANISEEYEVRHPKQIDTNCSYTYQGQRGLGNLSGSSFTFTLIPDDGTFQERNDILIQDQKKCPKIVNISPEQSSALIKGQTIEIGGSKKASGQKNMYAFSLSFNQNNAALDGKTAIQGHYEPRKKAIKGYVFKENDCFYKYAGIGGNWYFSLNLKGKNTSDFGVNAIERIKNIKAFFTADDFNELQRKVGTYENRPIETIEQSILGHTETLQTILDQLKPHLNQSNNNIKSAIKKITENLAPERMTSNLSDNNSERILLGFSRLISAIFNIEYLLLNATESKTNIQESILTNNKRKQSFSKYQVGIKDIIFNIKNEILSYFASIKDLDEHGKRAGILNKIVEELEQKKQTEQRKIQTLKNKETIWLVSFDGGGIRGIIGAQLLDHIFEQIGKHPTELFDFFAGTSTGGLIALSLNIPNDQGTSALSTKEVLSIYKEKGSFIFPDLNTWYKTASQAKSYMYDPTGYIWLLQSYYKTFRMRDLVKPTFVTTVDMTAGESIILSSYRKYKDLFIWKAGRSTSAAPTFFPPANIMGEDGKVHEFIDGGVTTNNPTHLALRQLKKICSTQTIQNGKEIKTTPWDGCPNLKQINVVSIGTGYQKHSHDFEVSGQGGLLGVIKAFTEVGSLFASRSADVLSEEFLEDLPRGMKYTYYRFDPEFKESIQLDGVDQQNLQTLMGLAHQIQCQSEFKTLLDHLTAHAAELDGKNINIGHQNEQGQKIFRLRGALKQCAQHNSPSQPHHSKRKSSKG